MTMHDSFHTGLQKLHTQQPDIPERFPSLNPFDVYRIHLANALSEVTGFQPKTIYPLLQRTATLDKGDLLLPVPACRIKEEKPDVLASRWAKQAIRPVALEHNPAHIVPTNLRSFRSPH